jgi:hypothetical protein
MTPRKKMNVWSISHGIMEEVSKGETTIEAVAKKFNVPEAEVKAHAKILADRKHITIHPKFRTTILKKR